MQPRSTLALAAALGLAAASAAAQDLLSGREARQATMSPRGQVEGVVIPHPGLSEPETQLLGAALDQGLLPDMAYYGALAIAPDAGLASQATTTAVGNFHDQAGADAAALNQCNAARSDGRDCVVVLQVRPRRWEPGAAIELSAEATAALRGEYRRFGRPRVMAISRATGQFGIGPSVESAVLACGADDCAPVIADG